ncbi:MAG: hypothetical protein WCT20_02195 [Candidatus Babeliales bacterium]|jgi:hypothetical protein
MAKLFEFTTDCYQEKRGGYSYLLEIHCKNCSSFLFFYQKDGEGDLFRCYLNRILAPELYASLKHSEDIKDETTMPLLACSNCKALIGEPMRHSDDRLAFRLDPNSFIQKIHPNQE